MYKKILPGSRHSSGSLIAGQSSCSGQNHVGFVVDKVTLR